jgi:16S rRNA (cytidine1402-2'-O)-methyltransferase
MHEKPQQESSTKKGTLYIVSTPIGNRRDITLRALDILREVDMVVCEEGKVGGRILGQNGITNELLPLNEHNEQDETIQCLRLLGEGKTLALIADCGTPLIADPGTSLTAQAIAAGHEIHAVPGPNSIITALTTSGLSSQQFLYAGFLSRDPKERLAELKELAQEPRTVILLETPYRLLRLLEATKSVIGKRRAYLGCNLTLPAETHHHGTVQELYDKFNEEKFKGEFVFCFEGNANPQPREDRKSYSRGSTYDNNRRDGGYKKSYKKDYRSGSRRDERGARGGYGNSRRDGGYKKDYRSDSHRDERNKDGGYQTVYRSDSRRDERGNREEGGHRFGKSDNNRRVARGRSRDSQQRKKFGF